MLTLKDVSRALNDEMVIASCCSVNGSKRMTFNPSWLRYSVWHDDVKIELTVDVSRALGAYNGLEV